MVLPSDPLITKNGPVGSLVFMYNKHDKLQLSTYCPKKGKMVVLPSNMHHESAITERSEKLEGIEYYNSTKTGVDPVGQMRHSYSCSRRAKRWPLAILDIVGLHRYTILNIYKSRTNEHMISRADFLCKLSL